MESKRARRLQRTGCHIRFYGIGLSMRSLLLVRPDRESNTDAALAADADCLIFDFSAVAAGSPAYEIARAFFSKARARPRAPLLYGRIPDLHDAAADACLD